MLDYIIILITLGIGIWGWLKKEKTSQLYVWLAIIILIVLSVLQVFSVKEGQKEISELQPRQLSSSSRILQGNKKHSRNGSKWQSGSTKLCNAIGEIVQDVRL